MSEYRLYCLDVANKITRSEEFVATGDDEAIMIARSKKLPMPCEIWQRNRLVGRIPAHDDTPKK